MEQRNVLLIADLKSCLQAMLSLKNDHPALIMIFYKLLELEDHNFNIWFCWVPGHCGIKGNKEADSAASEALSVDLEICTAPPIDLKPIICSYFNNQWQTEWDLYTMNKPDEISPNVGKRHFYKFFNRLDQGCISQKHRKPKLVVAPLVSMSLRYTEAYDAFGKRSPDCLYPL